MTENSASAQPQAGLERSSESSKLRESIKQYGNNSYYYAHSRPIEIPSNAIIREGDGVVTGGQPVLLARSSDSAASLAKPKRKITAFSWLDDNEKVKIYVEDAEWLRRASELEGEFFTQGFRFETSEAVFALDALDDEIEISGSSWKFSEKRFTISLKKKKPNKTWYSLRSSRAN